MKQIAEEFINCFVGIGKTICKSIGIPVKQFEAHLKGNYPVNVFMHPTQKPEIELVIQNVKTQCTKGFDGLST